MYNVSTMAGTNSSSEKQTNSEQRTFSTPMMQQYARIKSEYPDHLLLYRLGDFYELFMEDAHIGAKVLQIVLTRRPRGKDGDIPMAGVPYHAVDRYVGKLVKAGYKVAICEQVSAADGKGIVERDVVRIITSGTILDEGSLEQKEHNYIMALRLADKSIGVAVADLSTGLFQATQLSRSEPLKNLVSQELVRFQPSEILLHGDDYNNPQLLRILKMHGSANITKVDEWKTYTYNAENQLSEHFKVSTLKGFGFHNDAYAIEAAAAVLGYLQYTQRGNVSHMRTLLSYDPDDSVLLDASTLSNLEIFKNLHEGKRDGSLLSVLDDTQTAMGGRMLQEWLRKPLRNKKLIEERLDAVEMFYADSSLRDTVRALLSEMYDIERLVSRLSVGIGNAADLVNIASSLESVQKIHSTLKNAHYSAAKALTETLNVDIQNVVETVRERIVEDPPIDVRGGGLIQKGVHSELDELRSIVKDGKSWLADLEQKEKERTGITSLKVRYNKVFGYYIEVSKSFVDKVPKEYIGRQTLVNAERFITPELKTYEEKILNAQDTIEKIEYDEFQKTVRQVLSQTDILQKVSDAIAHVDCVANFAYSAMKNHYVRPSLTRKGAIILTDARHPVVEKYLDDNQFVPNSVTLDHGKNQLHIITGPNMAGKSVFIRQTALVVLMAHIGSFVPARKATVSIVDRIFVRSGASDMITSGLSTFMVEMVETAYILNHATPQSLIVLDEIGRGTSTYDGVSIAWAVSEYLVKNWKRGPRGLFATHYHELQDLEDVYPKNISTYHMAVEDHKGKPVFLHKVVPGGTSHSYGVAVADLAGVPEDVIASAKHKLHTLESQRIDTSVLKDDHGQNVQREILALDLDSMKPLDALQRLQELQEDIRKNVKD